MGAISDPSSIPILTEFQTDSARCVRETCEIAISKIQWDNSEEGNKDHNHTHDQSSVSSYICPNKKNANTHFCSNPSRPLRKFTSVDPAPASSSLLRGPSNADETSPESIQKLQNHLTNTSLPLFERYRAMFALRNIGTSAAVDALVSGFTDDSELFKCVAHFLSHFFPIIIIFCIFVTYRQTRSRFRIRSIVISTLCSCASQGTPGYFGIGHGQA
jgi:deoxyhypusine monooxygenase